MPWLKASLSSDSSVLLALGKSETIVSQRLNFILCLNLGNEYEQCTRFDYRHRWLYPMLAHKAATGASWYQEVKQCHRHVSCVMYAIPGTHKWHGMSFACHTCSSIAT
uniref:Uncharacterized protein n=1 Tax=Rhipicephalus pulchellus TaxID=72859 RepID=L7LU90_RHIPC